MAIGYKSDWNVRFVEKIEGYARFSGFVERIMGAKRYKGELQLSQVPLK